MGALSADPGDGPTPAGGFGSQSPYGRPEGPGRPGRPGDDPRGGDLDARPTFVQPRSRGDQPTQVNPRPTRRSRSGGPAGPAGPTGPGGNGGSGGGGGRPEGGPSPKRAGWRRFLPSWKIVMAGMVILVAGLFGMIAVGYANTPLPKQTQGEAVAQESAVYYSSGKKIASIGTPRKIVDIKDMAEAVQHAAVAIENKSFYEDSGIDLKGMVRSLFSTVSGEQVQGASTITQQMARNYYEGLSTERSLERKIKEIFVAVKINKEYTKDQIMANYLNTVNFGRAYGVEAAAQAYFTKKTHANNLTVEQAAYLAARIQQPNWGPKEPALVERWKQVLRNMAELWPDKYGQLPATAKFPKVRETLKDGQELCGLNGYMVSEVLRELKDKHNLTDEDIESGGYRIVSTFDERLMKEAKKAVLATTANWSKTFHAGLAAVDTKTGRVLASYGGSDYCTDNWNEPWDSKKQAASAFKSYVLAAWLDSGKSLKSWVPGNVTVPKQLPGTTPITNGHGGKAAIDVVNATAHSINTAYASMGYALPGQLEDIEKIVDDLGFNKERMRQSIDDHSYGFTIGSALVTPVEQASGYTMFANGGKHVPAHVVQGVYQGKKLVKGEIKHARQIISEGAAADSTYALQSVLKYGTAGGKGLGQYPAAGKTGTNNDEKEAWFVGYTPQISTAVGLYREQCIVVKTGKVVEPWGANCPTKPSKNYKGTKYGDHNPWSKGKEVSLGFEGAGPPTTIWRTFMLAAMEGKKVEQFPPPANIGVPDDIVPKPEPKPEKTEEDDNPFGEPLGDGDQGGCLFDICDDGSNGNGNAHGGNGNDNGNANDDTGSWGDGSDDGMGGSQAPPPPGAADVPDPLATNRDD
ncbi:transglycosylase domain-containing protein [Nonomuraea sp. NPDC050310]|uniref:transglycosylase domain-containing protein n=1 Tax=unclassified Nonomuraea TaxID=2593643 RepID=UPI0033D7158E